MKSVFSGPQFLRSSFSRAAVSAVVLGLMASPTVAFAQAAPTSQVRSAPSARPAVYTDSVDISARDYFGYREYIRGIQRPEEQYEQLRKYGCTLSPASFVPDIVEKAIAGGYMCGRKFFQEVGKKTNGGTMYDITYIGAEGATVVKSVKGNKVGQNYVQVATYSLAANSDGKPLTVTYNYHANGGQYMAQMLSSLPGTILGASLPSLVNAAVSGCDGPCQSGIVNIVSAGSQSSSIAATQSTQTTTVGSPVCGSNGPCYTPTPTQPGHTQN